MYYYRVLSKNVCLSECDSYVMSDIKLGDYDLLVIDTDEDSFVTCFVKEQVTTLEVACLQFEPHEILARVDVSSVIAKKANKRKMAILENKMSAIAKREKEIATLRKNATNPKIRALLEQWDELQMSCETSFSDEY